MPMHISRHMPMRMAAPWRLVPHISSAACMYLRTCSVDGTTGESETSSQLREKKVRARHLLAACGRFGVVHLHTNAPVCLKNATRNPLRDVPAACVCRPRGRWLYVSSLADGPTDRRMDRQADGWMGGRTDGLTGSTAGRPDGRTDGTERNGMDGTEARTDRQTDG